MASGPITSWEIDGGTVETVSDFIFLGPKSLQMVTAAMKLKDAYSSVLAWRIPGTGSLVGCRLWGCTESDMTEVT